MALKPQTQAHLARAERNRAVAQALVDPQRTVQVQPPAAEWACVVAFYAAVHYVNAYLWERWNHEPHDHAVRRGFLVREPRTHGILGAYDMLADLSWNARYQPAFRPRPALAHDAVHQRLEQVRVAIHAALGAPLP